MRSLRKIVLFITFVFYISTVFFISETAGFNQGPDEETNLAYIEFLTSTGRLPINYEERAQIGKDANWPALYHLSVAHLNRLLGVQVEGPPVIKIFWDSFRYRAIDAGQPWYYLRTEDQLRPYLGRMLALHLGRWVAIAFGALNLLLVYGVIQAVIPGRKGLATAGVALLAAWPVYVFMSGVLNEDTLMAAMGTLYLWLLVLIVKQPRRTWPYLLLGLVLGLSITIKYTTIILPLEVLVVLAVMTRRGHYNWQWAGKRLALVGGITTLAASWWFGWNFWYLNRIKEHGWFTGLLYPIFSGGPDVTLSRLGYYLSGGQIGLAGRPEGRQAGQFSEWVRATFLTFWAESVNDLPAWAPYTYLGLALLIGLVSFGLWRLWRADPAARTWLLLLVFHTAIFVILPLLRFMLSQRIGETAQGRHIFIPAAAAVIILIVWGAASALPGRWRWPGLAIIILGFVSLTGLITYRLVNSTPSPVPLRTAPQAAAWLSYPLDRRFGEAIELASYDLDPDPAAGRLQVNLAWRSLASVNQSYLLSLVLKNSEEAAVSQWLGYTGQGRVPTLAWEPGDVVFDRLALPLLDVPAGDYRLGIELLDEETGSVLGAALDLPVVLPAKTAAMSSAGLPVRRAGDLEFILWGAGGPAGGSAPTFRYPASFTILTQTPAAVRLLDPAGSTWSPQVSRGNKHTFVIGPRWPEGMYQLELAPQGAAGPQVTPLLQVENWWPRRFSPPESIEFPLQANFAGQLELLGYTLPQAAVKAGASFPITLYWRALPNKSPEAHFIQFNHFLDAAGSLRGGYDRIPLEYYSTLLWAPGEVVVDGDAVPVDPATSPGEYYLNVGYYLVVGEASINLPLVENDRPAAASSVTIGPIQVVP